MSLGYDVTGDKRYGPDWPIRIFGIINGASIKGVLATVIVFN